MIDKLEFLLYLAQEKHFGRAAEAAGITQPTLSAAVKSLEDQLNIKIVERGSRFRGFTPEGARVLDWARKLVGDARAMRQEIDALKHGLTGRLRLGVVPTALPFVTELTVPFRARYPGTSFEVLSLTSDSILARLENLEIEAGITYVDTEPTRRLQAMPLYEERYALLVAADTPLAKLSTITWNEAGRLALCLLTPDMQNRRIVDRHLMEAGGAQKPTLESNSMLLLYAHVSTGHWASIMPARFVETFESVGGARSTAGSGRLKAIALTDPTVTHKMGLILDRREPHGLLVEAFRTHAQRVASEVAAGVSLPLGANF